MLNHNKTIKTLSSVKRGDTIIEVMFAIAIFCLVAVISISLMNNGIASAENSLEAVTVRNELNAQAEAIRFIHSSYLSEMNLGECAAGVPHDQCQHFADLWGKIRNSAISPDDFSTFEYPTQSCADIYDYYDDNPATQTILPKYQAFILNTRNLHDDDAFISAKEHRSLFTESPLSARIIYKANDGSVSDEEYSESKNYDKIARAEGIWIIAVKGKEPVGGGEPQYYDFYIQSCWNGPKSNHSTDLDTVIRLYNPAGV